MVDEARVAVQGLCGIIVSAGEHQQSLGTCFPRQSLRVIDQGAADAMAAKGRLNM